MPDYRFSLANERTFLAWIRTGLALIAGGLACAQFLPPLPIQHLREVIAVALLVLGAVVALRAVDHWARIERAMRTGAEMPASRFPGVLAVGVARATPAGVAANRPVGRRGRAAVRTPGLPPASGTGHDPADRGRDGRLGR